MQDNMDMHFTGTFNIGGEEITGELIYNREKGVTLINLVKKLTDTPIGSSYGNLEIITGILNSGTAVTLFHNRCTKNHTQVLQNQQLVYVAEYSIWSKSNVKNKRYNKLVCVLENALDWSELSVIDTSEFSAIKFKDNKNEIVYHWFGAKITFSTSMHCELFSLPRKEESKVVERLVVSIEADEKQDTPYFTEIRNKVISLISFAIKDNVNVEEQFLCDYDDSYQIGEHTEYCKHYLYTSEQRLSIHNSSCLEYNFTLPQLLPEKDIKKELTLLEPILNLYLSLFKYTDMPPEMVFLNDIEKLLLCDTQKDENCKYIILVSRLNDLLIGKYDGMFWDYYATDDQFAQTVADTRHYYTHYGKSKEKKALKGDKLIDAIGILSLLLEYNVCLQLGIDNQSKVRERLSRIASWKQFQDNYQEEKEKKKS